jgi:hypothetical protein
MRRHRIVLLCAATLVAASCHSSRAVSTSSSATTTTATTTTTGASSTVSTAVTAPPGPVCPPGNDVIVPAVTPDIQLQAPGSPSLVEVTTGRALPCSSVVRVDKKGAVNFTFGTTAACQFLQDVETKPAIAVAREPDGTLVRVQEGVVYCTTKGGRRIKLCGSGDIQLNGDVNQVKATCNPDPVFQVGLNQGSAVVRDLAGGVSDIGAGDSLAYDFGTGSTGIGPAEFDAQEMAIFQRQAQRLKVPFQGSATTTTSTSSTTTTTTPPIP